MDLTTIAYNIAEECCRLIAVEGVDHYKAEAGHVIYSKHCGGGAFRSAFNFQIKDNLSFIIMPYIYGPKFGWKHGDEILVDLNNPDSFAQISAHIRKIFDGMWIDRRPWP